MKRILSIFLACAVLFLVPFGVSADGETVLTLEIPEEHSVTYTANKTQDAFALAVGYSLAEDCVGLSGYALTVRWDPEVLALNTNYSEDMTDDQMANATGCYFEDLYDDGLVIAPSGMRAINYRKVYEGEITVVSIGLDDFPYREAVLFVLDMLPLRGDVTTEISVEVKEIVGLTSSQGMIEHYQNRTSLSLQVNSNALYGDADGDGTLSLNDRLVIKRHACAIQPLKGNALLKADINGDGTVDARDYLLVCRELQKD